MQVIQQRKNGHGKEVGDNKKLNYSNSIKRN